MNKDHPVIAIIDNRLVKATFVKQKKNKFKVKTGTSFRFVAIDELCSPEIKARVNNHHGKLSFEIDPQSPTTAGELYAKFQQNNP